MSDPLDGAIVDGRHTMPVRVYYEDTDFTGIVYHANYLRYMERGRTNYLRLIGADHRALFEATEKEAPGFAFVVRSMTLDFLKPARMDDVLDVVTTPEEVKGASITLLQQCRRGDGLAVRGACARRVHFARPRASDPEAAAHRHEGRSRISPAAIALRQHPETRSLLLQRCVGQNARTPADHFIHQGRCRGGASACGASRRADAERGRQRVRCRRRHRGRAQCGRAVHVGTRRCGARDLLGRGREARAACSISCRACRRVFRSTASPAATTSSAARWRSARPEISRAGPNWCARMAGNRSPTRCRPAITLARDGFPLVDFNCRRDQRAGPAARACRICTKC